jgi:hypothetical protein
LHFLFFISLFFYFSILFLLYFFFFYQKSSKKNQHVDDIPEEESNISYDSTDFNAIFTARNKKNEKTEKVKKIEINDKQTENGNIKMRETEKENVEEDFDFLDDLNAPTNYDANNIDGICCFVC